MYCTFTPPNLFNNASYDYLLLLLCSQHAASEPQNIILNESLHKFISNSINTRKMLKIESENALFTCYFKIGIQPNAFSQGLYSTTVLMYLLFAIYAALFTYFTTFGRNIVFFFC